MTREQFTREIETKAAGMIKFSSNELETCGVVQFASEHVMLLTPDSVRNFPPEGAFKINYNEILGVEVKDGSVTIKTDRREWNCKIA